MKTRIIFGLSLGLAASSLAAADPRISPADLGGVDAVIQFCSQINPAGGPAYRALRESLIGKRSDDALKSAARTAAYRRAFTEVGGALAAARPDWALHACLDVVSAPVSRGRHN